MIGSYTASSDRASPNCPSTGSAGDDSSQLHPTDQLEVWSSSVMESFQLAIAIGIAGLIIVMRSVPSPVLVDAFGLRQSESCERVGEWYQNLYDSACVFQLLQPMERSNLWISSVGIWDIAKKS